MCVVRKTEKGVCVCVGDTYMTEVSRLQLSGPRIILLGKDYNVQSSKLFYTLKNFTIFNILHQSIL